MRPILQIEFVAVLDQRERLGPPAGLERLDDGPLMGDFHDGPTQDRVVVPAEFAKNAADFGQIVEAFLEPLDQLQRMVFALPRLEAAVARGAPRGLIHGRPLRTAHAPESAPGAERWVPTECGRVQPGARTSTKALGRPVPPRRDCRRYCAPCGGGSCQPTAERPYDRPVRGAVPSAPCKWACVRGREKRRKPRN